MRWTGEEGKTQTNLHTEHTLKKRADAEAKEVEEVIFAQCEVRFGGGDVVGKVVEATRC